MRAPPVHPLYTGRVPKMREPPLSAANPPAGQWDGSIFGKMKERRLFSPVDPGQHRRAEGGDDPAGKGERRLAGALSNCAAGRA